MQFFSAKRLHTYDTRTSNHIIDSLRTIVENKTLLNDRPDHFVAQVHVLFMIVDIIVWLSDRSSASLCVLYIYINTSIIKFYNVIKIQYFFLANISPIINNYMK